MAPPPCRPGGAWVGQAGLPARRFDRVPWLRAGLLLASISLGCATDGDPFQRGVWPFYTGDAVAWAGVREARVAGPLVHWETAVARGEGAERRFEARPFYSSRAKGDRSRWDVLYPIASRRMEPERSQTGLLLFGRTRSDREKGTRDRSAGLVFDGTTAEGQRYGGIFPFGGRFLKRLGHDRITFGLWPIYARAERGEYSETQILWPFFAFGRGEGRFKLRLWPFFGIDRRDGEHERRFWLWPLVHHRRERLSSDSPVDALYVLPFYGRRDAGPRSMRFYLFPLLGRQWDRSRPEVFSLDVLWPLFAASRDSEGTERLAVRPLYSRARSPDVETRGSVRSDSRTWLLGLFGRRRDRGGEFHNHEWRFLWAGRVGTRREAGAFERRVDLWPLYRHARSVDAHGDERGFTRLPYLLPMRGLDPDGWDRHYNKLFELYEARWLNAERRSSTLFGLREARSSPDGDWTSWGGLLHLRHPLAD